MKYEGSGDQPKIFSSTILLKGLAQCSHVIDTFMNHSKSSWEAPSIA